MQKEERREGEKTHRQTTMKSPLARALTQEQSNEGSVCLDCVLYYTTRVSSRGK